MKKNITVLIVLLIISHSIYSQAITTLAGGSGSGFADGTGSTAKFNYPSGITTDWYGNIYVADTNNNRIRAITSTGIVTTIAGSSIAGQGNVSDDGDGWNAKFNYPRALGKDALGNIYISDNNNRIRKMYNQTVTTIATDNGSSTGTIQGIYFNSGSFYLTFSDNQVRVLASGGSFGYTLAGSLSPGNVDGTGTTARFNEPYGICRDASGNSYVTDTQNHRIRKVTASGVVTTFAGSSLGYVDAIGTSAKFFDPKGICIDPSGNLYVADSRNKKIRKITPEGIVTTVVSTFYEPQAICIDNVGNLYVTCWANSDFTINKITLNNLDLNDNTLINNLKVYPNPANDHITIDCGTLTNVNGYNVKITNTLGQEVFNQPMKTQQYFIPLSWTGRGFYFVSIINAQGKVIDVRKIILQ